MGAVWASAAAEEKAAAARTKIVTFMACCTMGLLVQIAGQLQVPVGGDGASWAAGAARPECGHDHGTGRACANNGKQPVVKRSPLCLIAGKCKGRICWNEELIGAINVFFDAVSKIIGN